MAKAVFCDVAGHGVRQWDERLKRWRCATCGAFLVEEQKVNENLSPGMHTDPKGLAWWQERDGLIIAAREVLGPTEARWKPFVKFLPPTDATEEQVWSRVHQLDKEVAA